MDDKKGIAGYGCLPQSGKFQADFLYAGGAIANSALVARNVVCTIIRDNYGTGPDDGDDFGRDVDRAYVYYTRDSAARSDFLVCRVLVRSLATGDVTDAKVATDNNSVGNGIIVLGQLADTSPLDAIYMFRQLPAKSRLLSRRWEDDVDDINANRVPTNGTELGEGE